MGIAGAEENVANASALVEEFHQQYLDKLGLQPMTIRNTRRLELGIEPMTQIHIDHYDGSYAC